LHAPLGNIAELQPQPGDILGGSECNLYQTTKHVFEIFWGNCSVAPLWLLACCE